MIGQAVTAQAGQVGQAVTVGGAVLPGADRGRGRLALVPAAPDPPARVPLAPFQGGTVSPPDDPAKCRRAKGSDSSLNGISPHR